MIDREILRVEGLSAAYGKQEILHHINFSIAKGQLCALLGVNGVGKTMLMKSIAQRLPHTGRCYCGEAVLEQLKPKDLAKRISYIPQRSGLQLSLPVLDVVLMGFNPQLKLLEHPSSLQKKKAETALNAVGLGFAVNADYQTLSEGQKQLVYLARTLIEDSPLLLLDEPDSALDPQNRHQILRLLKQLVHDSERAGLLCLHDPQLALEFCDKLILLKDGSVFAEIYPQKDSVERIEEAFRMLYGAVEVAEHQDQRGKKHLILLWEDVE